MKLQNQAVPHAADLVGLLRRRAQERPADVAYTFLADGELRADSLTYAELDERARALAVRVAGVGGGDRRVVLLYPPGLDFVVGLFGCLYAGVAAVPAYPPDPLRPERTIPRLESLLRDCRPVAVLSVAGLIPALRQHLGQVLEGAGAVWLSSDESDLSDGDGFEPAHPDAESIAVVQYTSGSTADPKGVLLSHGNLMACLRQIYLRFEVWNDSGCVSWVPPYHDMGLIGGILLSLYGGYTHTFMAPWSFLERPIRWLEAIARTRSTITGAPNFAYDLVVRKTTREEREALDLSCFRKAVCGAEHIRPETVRRFLDAFAVSGFRPEAFTPAYGLAESTLIVTGNECGTAPSTEGGAVGCGPPVDGAEVTIVDPESRRELPAGAEGEIWVAGPTVGLGYWGRPEESDAVFRARLADAPERGPFLRTGDLGSLDDAGLIVSGRIKDLVIVRGRNLAPEDVEKIAEGAHPALRPGCAAAFSVAVDGEERLALAAEVRSGYDDDLEPVWEAVRRAVATELLVSPHAISLLDAGTLPKTSSGKLQRARCRASFEAGDLSVLAEWRETTQAPDPELTPAPEPQVAPRGLASRPGPARRPDGGSAKPDAAEPIAVVGIGCRFPGASGPRALWNLLEAGEDPIREVPRERFDIDALYDPDPSAPGSITSRFGGFVDGVAEFEPLFFGITPREADTMDPQQRLLLEVAWEALEDAGWPPSALAGTRTGVFVGVGGTDYAHLLERNGDPSRIDPYMGTGNAHSITANRISYLFDFRGPSLALDTACSSSSVAVHLACQSLRLGEADTALAGGVNLILVPEISIAFSRARMLAPDGRCKTFDAEANGYVRSDGCGVVVLKRVSDAVRDGDEIWGLLLGSAVNQDGRTSGITVPSRSAQREVFEDALARAGIGANRVGYVEAHGTGTAIGDPTEVEALRDVLSDGERPDDSPCYLGSIKASIGHSECAAGVAGLIKTLLCLRHERIPAQLHLNELNPRIQLEGSPLEIATEPISWPATEEPRVAAVSSFGFGGTNTQLIVGDAPPAPEVRTGERPLHVLTLSGRTPEALGEGAEALANHLAANPDLSLADVGHTLNTGREHLIHRAAVLASTAEEARSRLEALAAGKSARGIAVGKVAERHAPRIAFVFTGQGSQYADMGRELYETQPVFRQALDRCAEYADPHLDRPLLSVMFPPRDDCEASARIDRTAYTQPALFALEVALCELWKSWGIVPDAVMGHSLGEYAAAWAAGCLELGPTLELLVRRGELMESAPPGRMIAVSADADRVRAEIGGLSDQISVAAINAPDLTVISGGEDALGKLLPALETAGIRTEPLNANRGIHSPAIEPILDDLEAAAARLETRPPERPLVSNVTGAFATDAPDAVYWRRHAREPVRFLEGVRALFDGGVDIVVEIGPSPVLLALGRRCVERGVGEWVPSLRRAGDDWPALGSALSKLYTLGARIDWQGFDAGFAARKLRLPTTRFQRERHYPTPESPESAAGTPLLARSVDSALDTHIFEADVGGRPLGYLADHRIQGSAVFPMTGFLGMAIAAARRETGEGPVRLDDVSIQQALIVPKGDFRTAQILISPSSGGAAAFEIASRRSDRPGDGTPKAGGWTRHASGTLRAVATPDAPELARVDLASVRERCSEEIAADDLYAELDRRGLQYGPAFRGVEKLWRSDGEALGEVVRTGPTSRPRSPDPALLDACLQLLAAAMPAEQVAKAGAQTWLPVGLDRLELHAELPERVLSHSRWDATADDGALSGSVRILDPSGGVLAEISGLRWIAFGGASAGADADTLPSELLRSDWDPAPPPDAGDERPGHWVVLADRGGAGVELARALTDRGHSCSVATAEDVAAAAANGSTRLEAFLGRALPGGGPSSGFRGVVHLWSLDASLPADGSEPDLGAAADLGAASLLELVGALGRSAAKDAPRVVVVTRGAQAAGPGETVRQPLQAPVWGMAQVIALEHPALRCLRIDLDPGVSSAPPPDPEVTSEADRVADELDALVFEDQVAFRGDERRVRRLRRVEREAEAMRRPAAESFALEIPRAGSLDRLALQERPRLAPPPGAVEIEVRAAGLNFRDVLSAMGQYPGGPIALGSECSGVVARIGDEVEGLAVGDPVVALAPGCMGTFATTLADLVLPKPARLDFTDAAGVPIVFATAAWALDHLARLSAGERVLIHAGAGGVGLAALQIARRAGAEIFATAGSPEKRAYLESLGVEHVMDSRSLDFADEIAFATDGAGVDVVLNSLPGEFIKASLASLGAYGRFVEIGRTDIYRDTRIGLAPFRNNLSYFAVDLDRLSRERPKQVRAQLEAVLADMESGALEPVRSVAFPVTDAVAGFRSMAQRKNTGKIVVSLEPEVNEEGAAAAPVRPDGTYLVTGGTGALGLEIARWLAEQGARHVALVSRGGEDERVAAALSPLRADGVSVQVEAADVADPGALARALERIRAKGHPVRGVVHAAGVLSDGLLTHLDRAALETVLAPKVDGAWNLHSATRDDPLDFFALFSSVAAVLGSPGQGNYAAGNAFLDALASWRRGRGRPGVSIAWGPWEGPGMAGSEAVVRALQARGIEPIAPDDATDWLSRLVAGDEAQPIVVRADWARLFGRLERGQVPPQLLVLAEGVERDGARDAAARAEVDAVLALPEDERKSALVDALQNRLAVIMGIDDGRVDPEAPLADLGLDSLMALELLDGVEMAFGVTLAIEHVVDDPTLADIAEAILGHLTASAEAPEDATLDASASSTSEDSSVDSPANATASSPAVGEGSPPARS